MEDMMDRARTRQRRRRGKLLMKGDPSEPIELHQGMRLVHSNEHALSGNLDVDDTVAIGRQLCVGKVCISDADLQKVQLLEESSSKSKSSSKVSPTTLRMAGARSEFNKMRDPTVFADDRTGMNWIRGDTQLVGALRVDGPTYLAQKVPVTDATTFTHVVVGDTDSSHLRMGRHSEYSFLQASGPHAKSEKTLMLNPLGGQVCAAGVCFTKAEWQRLKQLTSSSSPKVVDERRRGLRGQTR